MNGSIMVEWPTSYSWRPIARLAVLSYHLSRWFTSGLAISRRFARLITWSNVDHHDRPSNYLRLVVRLIFVQSQIITREVADQSCDHSKNNRSLRLRCEVVENHCVCLDTISNNRTITKSCDPWWLGFLRSMSVYNWFFHRRLWT